MKISLLEIKSKLITSLTVIILFCANATNAQNPGDRAQKFRGTWWSGVHPTLLDDRMLNLRTLDGFGVGFTNGASLSAEHFAPVPLLSDLPGYDTTFPPVGDTFVIDQMVKITDADKMVQAYTNCENFLGNNQDHLIEFSESWKNWCDTNPLAQAFINSQSYHRQDGFPDRPYMFCYAEFILKHYSLVYGEYIDIWVFDDGHSMVEHGDNATSGNIEDQRLYLAFADAARAGNNEIAVSFNNGRSRANFNSYPFAHAVRADDFTFGHAFGGNNNHAEKVNGNQFNLNYQHVDRMRETNGHVHEGGSWTWDDSIVGHYFSKLSTTAWNFGPQQAWEQDDFNEWHEEALSAGGMMTWSGSYNRPVTFVYDWVYPLLKATDDYLFERGISINAENNGNPIIEEPITEETPIEQPENITVESTFIPDPNKTYYIDSLVHDLRLAATGNTEDPYTTAIETVNNDVKWKFTQNENGSWHIDRADGGTLPRLRTDNSSSADMQENTFDGRWESFSFTEGSIEGTHFITSFNGPNDFRRLQVDNNGNVNMVTDNSNGTWESFLITEAPLTLNRIVHITKRNAPDFAIDGNHGGENEQNIYLWAQDENNINQQWIEIDRGNGYFTYQKMGTNFAIDGDNGGVREQNVYLFTINENNQNQHWQKIPTGGGSFKLVKRNAPEFALNGGNGGINEQNINLFDSSSTSRNLQWFITPVGELSNEVINSFSTEETITLDATYYRCLQH